MGRIGGNRHALLPALAVLLAAVLWATIGTAYALYDRHIRADPLTVVTIRALAAGALIAGWLLWRDRSALRIERRDLPRFLAYGFVSVTLFYIVLIYSFRLTSVAVGTLLLFLAPAFVTLGAALFFGDRLTRPTIAALVAAFAGCVLIVEAYRPANLSGNALGIGLGVLSALSYAGFSLIGKPLIARYRLPTVVFWYLIVGLSGLLMLKLVLTPADWPSWSGVLVIGAYSGVFNTLLPVSFYTWGLRRLPPSEASILAMVEPVCAMILAGTVLGERLGWPQIGGAACIVAGVAMLALRNSVGRRGPAPVLQPPTG